MVFEHHRGENLEGGKGYDIGQYVEPGVLAKRVDQGRTARFFAENRGDVFGAARIFERHHQRNINRPARVKPCDLWKNQADNGHRKSCCDR